jgi:predicted lipid-binding transport protein (Tim44 family)
MSDNNNEKTPNPEMRAPVSGTQAVQTAPTTDEPEPMQADPTVTNEPAPMAEVGQPAPEPMQAEPAVTNEPAPTAEAGRPALEPMKHEELWAELAEFRQRFDEIQAEFIAEPRGAVEKAETLIEEAVDRMMNALHDQLRRIHTDVGDDTDTEHLRVAMLSYRELIDSMGDHRAA